MPYSTRVLTTLLLPLLLAACAAPIAEQKRAGFLSDYERLAPVEKNAYRYTSASIADYDKLLIDEPVFLLDSAIDNGKAMFTDEELKALSAHVRERLKKVLTEKERFEVVDQAGPGVARVRIAFTALDASQGALNVTLYTKVTGAGLGGAAMESEVVDSLSNEQLSASVQWGNDSRFLRAGFSKLGGAKLQSNRWIKSLHERIKVVDAQ
ncbi:MAG: DUF3313 domain-containing protein [Gammaproteobacteria bacterium]